MTNPSQTILLIDDEKDLALGLAALLRRAGYKILIATDGNEGLRLAQTGSPDLIMCDVMMPPPNGLQLRKLLASDPSTAAIPFIFLTARTQQPDKNTGLSMGADDYITKPFDRQELLLRIQAVLRRQELGRQEGWQSSQQEIEQFKKNITRAFNQEFQTPLPTILATLETVLRRSFESAPERSHILLQAALNNTEKTQEIIQNLTAMGSLDPNTPAIVRDPIDIQVDFIWLLQDLVENYSQKNLELRLILEPDVTNWASVFRNESPNPAKSADPRIVIRAPREEFTKAMFALANYVFESSPDNGRVGINLAYNGFGGCLLTATRQGATLTPEMTDTVFSQHRDLVSARQFARRLGGDLVILDAISGGHLRLILPPGK